jgi:hypothetical protein
VYIGSIPVRGPMSKPDDGFRIELRDPPAITRSTLRTALANVGQRAHREWLTCQDDSIRCARLQAKFELCDELAAELGL